ncbi:hypothetical protein HA402_004977 [Bradysia odoriphaga]|nr:hypothetical protein HA402_004977 [Bradysia odoriphaga]
MPRALERLHLTKSEENILSNKGYEISAKLGEGAYAKVYLSEYKKGNEATKLACKIVDTKKSSKTYVSKFLPRELDCLMKLKHPHIVHVHSIFRRNSKYYIFMRYAEKGDLMDYIVQFGAVSEIQTRFWARQIALAIQYLHTLGIAHSRDVKCENILITENNNVKLTDFGFSRYILDTNSKQILSDTYCGSLLYTSPEILQGIPYEPTKADVWAVGVLIFTMLNKCVPFDNSNITILYQSQVKRKYKFRERICGNVTMEVKKMIKHLLEPIPKKRLSINEALEDEWFKMDSRLLKLSDFEKAALDEAKRLDISKMTAPTIDSVNAKISQKASERTMKDGNLLIGIGDKILEPTHKPTVVALEQKPSAKSHRNQPTIGATLEQKRSAK